MQEIGVEVQCFCKIRIYRLEYFYAFGALVVFVVL